MIRRLLPSLALALAIAVGGLGTAASAQPWPGECVTRRVTGPGGAYRWDRVECEAHAGMSDFDRWGDDRRPLDVVAGPAAYGPAWDGLLQGDRYGGWRPAPAYPAYDAGADGGGRYPDPYPTYRAAGRDAAGFLVWPGKLP
jgi:hypothetical protein